MVLVLLVNLALSRKKTVTRVRLGTTVFRVKSAVPAPRVLTNLILVGLLARIVKSAILATIAPTLQLIDPRQFVHRVITALLKPLSPFLAVKVTTARKVRPLRQTAQVDTTVRSRPLTYAEPGTTAQSVRWVQTHRFI